MQAHACALTTRANPGNQLTAVEIRLQSEDIHRERMQKEAPISGLGNNRRAFCGGKDESGKRQTRALGADSRLHTFERFVFSTGISSSKRRNDCRGFHSGGKGSQRNAPRDHGSGKRPGHSGSHKVRGLQEVRIGLHGIQRWKSLPNDREDQGQSKPQFWTKGTLLWATRPRRLGRWPRHPGCLQTMSPPCALCERMSERRNRYEPLNECSRCGP